MPENNYKSSIPPGSFPSQGTLHHIMGHKTGRFHNLLSQYEYDFFIILDFADNVKDIKEQMALDLEETQFIADALGVKHPFDHKKKKLHPMSTDFLVVLEDRTVARSFKPLENLSKRTIEKLEIERIYWERRSVSWAIVTEQQLPNNLVENLREFREFYTLEEQGNLPVRVLHEYVLLWDENLTISQLVNEVSESLEISYEECYQIVKHLLAHKKLHFNHTYRFSEDLLLEQGGCHVRGYHQ